METFKVRSAREPGWFWSANEIIDRYMPALTVYGLGVYVYLCRWADNSTGEADPTIPMIARKLNIADSSTQKALKELAQLGLISIEQRKVTDKKGKTINISNLYTVLPIPKENAEGGPHGDLDRVKDQVAGPSERPGMARATGTLKDCIDLDSRNTDPDYSNIRQSAHIADAPHPNPVLGLSEQTASIAQQQPSPKDAALRQPTIGFAPKPITAPPSAPSSPTPPEAMAAGGGVVAPELKKPRKVEPFTAAFIAAFDAHYAPVRCTPNKGDGVKLAILKSKQGEAFLLEDWQIAIANYFKTPQSCHTLADLANRYATFRKNALDQYNKPARGLEAPTKVVQPVDEEAERRKYEARMQEQETEQAARRERERIKNTPEAKAAFREEMRLLQIKLGLPEMVSKKDLPWHRHDREETV